MKALFFAVLSLFSTPASPETRHAENMAKKGHPALSEADDIRGLIKLMGAESYTARESASRRLLEYGSRAITPLLDNLMNEDAEIQWRVRSVLSKLTPDYSEIKEDVVDELIANVKHKDKTISTFVGDQLKRVFGDTALTLPNLSYDALVSHKKKRNEAHRLLIAMAKDCFACHRQDLSSDGEYLAYRGKPLTNEAIAKIASQHALSGFLSNELAVQFREWMSKN